MHFVLPGLIRGLKPKDNVCVKLEDTDEALAYAVLLECGLGAVMIADKEYPGKVAIKILHDLLVLFQKTVAPNQYQAAEKDIEVKFPQLEEMIKKYQDPKEADKLLKLEFELGQTQMILNKTMNDVSKPFKTAR